MNIRSGLIFLKLVLPVLALSLSPQAGADGELEGSGLVIFNMTGNGNNLAISLNLDFLPGGGKGDTAINDGHGGNAINIENIHVVSRALDENRKWQAKLSVGASEETVTENLIDNPNDVQKHFLPPTDHLFNLDRLREISDWLGKKGNISPDAGIKISDEFPIPKEDQWPDYPNAGTYGTISLEQLLYNIVNHRTMYGMVRVLVPLEYGNSNSSLNALGEEVESGTLYGFCKSNKNDNVDKENDMCACAPGSGDIKFGGAGLCNVPIPDDGEIRVKGSMLWDFVASKTSGQSKLSIGDPIPLSMLPVAPRELYFKVIIPIMVNWANDTETRVNWPEGGDGAMDSALLVGLATSGGTDDTFLDDLVLDLSDIAAESLTEFAYYTGVTLTEEILDKLDNASKFHLLNPSGYANGWADAFDKLNITATTWSNIPVDPTLGMPKDVGGNIPTADDIRSSEFEDLPTYLYSGGLIDMHDHVNISGLLYVPQGMELEAKDQSFGRMGEHTRQYVSGAIMVRDTFYIEAKSNTITLISSDPRSYSTALTSGEPSVLTSESILSYESSTVAGSPVFPDGPDGPDGPDDSDVPCWPGCGNENPEGEGLPPRPNWNLLEVRPRLEHIVAEE